MVFSFVFAIIKVDSGIDPAERGKSEKISIRAEREDGTKAIFCRLCDAALYHRRYRHAGEEADPPEFGVCTDERRRYGDELGRAAAK